MINSLERERLVKIVNRYHNSKNPELSRAGYCVIIGYSNEKSLSEICGFYQVQESDALYWWEYFGFNDSLAKPVKKKKRKQSDIFEYLKNNAGSEITVKQLTEECSISSPTAYKFINDNIGWFKKVKRGLYEIIDADEERKKEKARRG